ncbi:MAG: ABC transporter [Planctomycetia bacterium]|nr:ABC transporter permease [Planctomycetota bacterium]
MRSIRIICILAGRHVRVLSRSPATIAVVFLPSVVLYTIFTQIFAGPAGRPFRVAVIDEDQSPASRRLIEELVEQNVRIIRNESESAGAAPLTAESAQNLIRNQGKFRVALVIPKGFGEAPNMMSGPRHKGVIVYYDKLEPTESEIVVGMLQMAAGREFFEGMMRPLASVAGEQSTTAPANQKLLVRVDRRDVTSQRMKIAAKHTFLAGIVPMFLLFSAAAAARAILEALGTGEMRRLLAAPITPAHILLGEMLYALLIAMVQCYAMYLYAWLLFGVDIWAITGGLLLLTITTCLATTGFGVLIGSFCRNAEQIDSVGTVVVLAMSAVGGSMVPRWIMPEWMQKLGLLTINGWSYDGFMGLIQGQGLRGIMPECLVLTAIAIGSASLGSYLFARRLAANPTG